MKWFGFLLVFLIWQCQGESEDSSLVTTELEGSWLGSCDSENASSSQATMTFTGNVISATNVSYSDANCSSSNLVTISSGTFIIGDSVSEVDGAKELNISIENLVFSLNSQEIVEEYNANSFCGKSDWVLETATPVTPSQCGIATDPILDIFKINGDSLQLGNPEGIDDQAKTRPSVLDDINFTKQ